MEWQRDTEGVPIKSWCSEPEEEALVQAKNLALHGTVKSHVALMADCHVGYGMPIGGVIACKDSIIPNGVGVDIGCGIGALETDIPVEELKNERIVKILQTVKTFVPVGEGRSNRSITRWEGFDNYLNAVGIEEDDYKSRKVPGWRKPKTWELALKNLGSLGGGNHFIELQSSNEGFLWLMIHTGSRNLGYRIAEYYHKLAKQKNLNDKLQLPSQDLAFLSTFKGKGVSYIRDMNFALDYAAHNRRIIVDHFRNSVAKEFPGVNFKREINIHHNYAALEDHFGEKLWVHRKGATSARKGELGIIPGSMGTSSYIVEGLGNPDSFMSCSHGAGRILGRKQASRVLTLEQCNRDMEGVVFDGWNHFVSFGRRRKEKDPILDFGEAPGAYKDIDEVIRLQKDLVKVLVKLKPLGVIKG